ncbi:MAG TPA: hypothetical protein VEK39_03405 [Solirubrobacterales bacterium]|nr:hypothetical protein [Solirubrobacterales bacterium]
MTKRRKFLIGGAAALALAAGGTGVALATGAVGENDDAEQVSGPDSDKARAAALEITGGGTANSVELDSENGATWEVEVTKPDGETVDVRLDDNYDLVVVEGDDEGGDGSEQHEGDESSEQHEEAD